MYSNNTIVLLITSVHLKDTKIYDHIDIKHNDIYLKGTKLLVASPIAEPGVVS